jgi:PcRGLX-like N-terminal RIFT barrel domain
MDVEAKIYLERPSANVCGEEPVRIGIPFPKGFVRDAGLLRVRNDLKEEKPLQSRPLALWPDGSIKWALLDFIASVPRSSRTTYKLDRYSEGEKGRPGIAERLVLREEDEDLVVETGASEFCIPRRYFGPFRRVSIGDLNIILGEGSQTHITDESGHIHRPVVNSIVEEENGPVRLTLRVDGRFMARHRECLCLFKARLTFYNGLSLVRMEFQIHNPRAAVHLGGRWDLGDPASVLFNDLSISLYPKDGISRSQWCAESPGGIVEAPTNEWLLYQDSSGGENWNSKNHVDRKGRLQSSFRGYRVYNVENGHRKLIAQGNRANPYVKVLTSSGWIAAAIKDFWQNFPKAVRFDGDHLSFGLFPRESKGDFELQGGEQKRHTIFLDFGLLEQESLIPRMQHPVHAWVDPSWLEETKAIPYFIPENDDPNEIYVKYVSNIVEGPNSFFNKREMIDEYGWRNFGDLYADHEAVNHKGPHRLVSHYNNQYDFIYSALVHFLRTGDRRWYQLMDESARHTIDIDIYHTDEDKPAYNHGLFWHTDHYKGAETCTHRTYSRRNRGGKSYGGGPSNEHNYTSGLLYYYYLTGDAEAADAVLELADWVVGMDEGSRTFLGLLDEGPTGFATATCSREYHGPGRGAGNSVNALMDAYKLSKKRQYMTKAEELIQRCIHPQDDVEALKLEDPEYRWSYLVFLQVLGKYLEAKVELKEMDYLFFYSRDSFLHYIDWMVASEVPYKKVLNKVEIPTETWPAQDIRKCHVFHLAAKYGTPEKRSAYREKAVSFFDACLTDLLSFETAYVTRPMVILLAYGFVHSYFQKQNGLQFEFANHCHDFGTPVNFVPQRSRLAKTLGAKARVLTNDIKRGLFAQWDICRRRLPRLR